MVPAKADVASVVDEVFVAAEGIGLGKVERAAGGYTAARYKRERLVVAEAGKNIVSRVNDSSSRVSNLVSFRLRTGSLMKL